jgi:hypothetical protein
MYLGGATLLLAHFYTVHSLLADFTPTTAWIYTQVNSRHNISTTTIKQFQVATVVYVLTFINNTSCFEGFSRV